MPCIKAVVNVNCQYCRGLTIKFGKAGTAQRYRCKNCKRAQLQRYVKYAYKASVNSNIAAHVKEGCSIRSIARLLKISAGTVLKRIKALLTISKNHLYQQAGYMKLMN